VKQRLAEQMQEKSSNSLQTFLRKFIYRRRGESILYLVHAALDRDPYEEGDLVHPGSTDQEGGSEKWEKRGSIRNTLLVLIIEITCFPMP